jgi:hypothetical protein
MQIEKEKTAQNFPQKEENRRKWQYSVKNRKRYLCNTTAKNGC